MLRGYQLIGVVCIALLLCALGMGLAAPDQVSPTPAAPGSSGGESSGGPTVLPVEPLDAPAGLGEAMAVEQILQTRHQQGDIFAGTVFEASDAQGVAGGSSGEDPSDEEFLQALRRVIRTAPEPAATASGEMSHACETGYQQRVQREQRSDEPDEELVIALRCACRQLDRKANDLEESRRWAEADQLRQLSATLRAESRRWADWAPSAPRTAVEQAGRTVPVGAGVR